jgi:SNF2 family DNA or RNA helicase
MWEAMQGRGYQTLVPAFAKEVGNYFNASQPGTGKTIETLATLAELEVGKRVLVVAPKKAIQSTWPREIAKWLGADTTVSTLVCDSSLGTMAKRNEALAEYAEDSLRDVRWGFALINPEAMRWEFSCEAAGCNGRKRQCPQRKTHRKNPVLPALFDIRWDAIIMDETHKMMMHSNERSSSVSGWGYGAQKLKVGANGIKIGLSGTPFKGKPRRFWPVLHWLCPDIYSGQWRWVESYFKMEYNPFSNNGVPTDEFLPGAEKLFNEDLDRIMVRHTKAELREINPAWAPPEKIHVEIVLPMEAKQAKAYGQMHNDAAARLGDEELTAEGILAERLRLRQFASAYGTMVGGFFTPSLPSNKWEWIKEALEERGIAKGVNDGAGKVVIASQFTSLLDVFANALDKEGIPWLRIDGSSKDVSEVEELWQSAQTDFRVLLLSSQAGGVSLTLDAADDLFLVDESDSPDDQEQVEDRIHRTSRTDHQVTIYHLQSEGTIDEAMALGNALRDFGQKAILDGRRGVDVVTRLLGRS